jgi:hypothetical protein
MKTKHQTMENAMFPHPGMNPTDRGNSVQKVNELLSMMSRKGVELWIDGKQLRYRALPGVLTQNDFIELHKLKSEILAALSRSISPIERAPYLAPLTFQQEDVVDRIEFTRSLWDGFAQRIFGVLNEQLLCQSIEMLISRHESLRTKILRVEGVWKQRIEPPEGFKLDVVRIQGKSGRETESEARCLVSRFLSEQDKSSTDSLFRVLLIDMAKHEHVLAIAIHHLIGADAATLTILFRDLWAIYRDLSFDRQPTLPYVPMHLADYAVWQRNTHFDLLNDRTDYWKKRLEGAVCVRLPIDSGLDNVEANTAASLQLRFGKTLSSALHNLASRERTIPAMAIVAAYVSVLSRWCNETDLTIPFTVSGRFLPAHDHVLGSMYQILILRINLTRSETFIDLLRLIAREFLTAWDFMDARVIRDTVGGKELYRGGILQWVPWDPDELEGAVMQANRGEVMLPLKIERFPFGIDRWCPQKIQYDVALHFLNSTDGICAYGCYRADRFKLSTMQQFFEDIKLACEQMCIIRA